MTKNRTVLIGLILSLFAGCSQEGFGGPPLKEGIYVGVSSCRTSGTFVPTTFGTRNETVVISENGLPMIDGIELSEGQVLTINAIGLSAVGIVDSVTESTNGVQIRGEGLIEVDLGQGQVGFVSILQNVSYRSAGLGTITFTDTTVLTESTTQGLSTVNIECSADLSRS